MYLIQGRKKKKLKLDLEGRFKENYKRIVEKRLREREKVKRNKGFFFKYTVLINDN